MILKQIKIKSARKDHECNASLFLTDSNIYCDYLNKYNYFTHDEVAAIERAMVNKFAVKKGEEAIYCVGKDGDDFWHNWSIPAIHEICVKYELYNDY